MDREGGSGVEVCIQGVGETISDRSENDRGGGGDEANFAGVVFYLIADFECIFGIDFDFGYRLNFIYNQGAEVGLDVPVLPR